MMKVTQSLTQEKLPVESEDFQVCKQCLRMNLDWISNKITSPSYQIFQYVSLSDFEGQITFGECSGYHHNAWNRKESIYVLPRSQRWLEIQSKFFIER